MGVTGVAEVVVVGGVGGIVGDVGEVGVVGVVGEVGEVGEVGDVGLPGSDVVPVAEVGDVGAMDADGFDGVTLTSPPRLPDVGVVDPLVAVLALGETPELEPLLWPQPMASGPMRVVSPTTNAVFRTGSPPRAGVRAALRAELAGESWAPCGRKARVTSDFRTTPE